MSSWKIEYGVLTSKQIAAGHDKSTVCNLNIVLYHEDKPVGNVIGCKVILAQDGKYYFSSNSQNNNGSYFNFTGFTKQAKDAIVAKALALEKAGKLVTKWGFRSEYNPSRQKAAMSVRDTSVSSEDKPAEKQPVADTPVFSG